MESLQMYGGLTAEELESVDARLSEKLNIAFDNIAHEASVLKEELNDLKSIQAEVTERHSSELSNLESELKRCRQKEDEYTKLLDSLDEKFRSAYSEKEELRAKLDDTVAINSELNYAIRNLENEREAINEQLKHKLDSLDELSAEIKSLKAEAENVRKLKMDTLFKLEDIASREASVKAQEGRWRDEVTSLNDHNRWLEERLRETSDQLATIRRDTSQKGYALESELNMRTVELENSKKMIERLEETIRRLNQSNEDYIQKLKLVTDEQIKLEQLYNSEVDAQKQLVNLYKEQVKELEEKNEALSNGAVSMQSLLKEAYENVSRLESEKTSLKSQYTEEFTKMQKTTQTLAVELEQSQQLLDKFRVDGLSEEELRHINPAVAATLTALKRGHSLTQLYADYIQVVEDRDQLRLDKQRLTEYVEQLVSDLKEKAPILRNQQEEFKMLQTQVKDLKVQLQLSSEKLDEAQIHQQEYKRNAGFYQRENVRLKQTCADLSLQVQTLLREVETAHGTIIHDGPGSNSMGDSSRLSEYALPDSSSTNAHTLIDLLDKISSAGVVINDHLVTWRNLEELQAQNQKLLCIARDLANLLEQKENEETETSKQIVELSTRLETLSSELDLVRLSARQARSEANALARQKDQYRSLLEHYDINVPEDDGNVSQNDSVVGESAVTASPTTTKGKVNSTSNVSTTAVERLEETLSSLQAEFKRYREEKSESDNVYTTTIENLRKEGNEARLLNQKLAAQLDFTHEKLRTLETNVAGYKQEITVLREMNARYSTSAAASEAELSRLRDQLAQTNERLTTAEVDARHFSRLLDASRANESRWKQEIDSLRRQEQTHAQLMHHLEVIQGNLEQRDSSDRSAMERRIEQLEKQLVSAQSTLSETSQAARVAQETLQNELAVARANTVSAEQEVERLSGLLQATETQLTSVQRSYDDVMKSASPSQTSELLQNSQVQIRELQHEISSLQSSLEAARLQATQMRDLAESAEKRLNEVVEENKQLEAHNSRNMTEIKQRCEFLEAQLDLEKKERQNLVNENIRTTEGAHQLNAELRKELATLQSEFDTMKVRYESALELESSAKTKIESHQRAAQEAREKYERELALHAEDVEAITESRRQLDNLRTELSNVRQELCSAKLSAEVAQTELKTQTDVWETTRQNLTEQLAHSTEDQNQMQEQIIKLTQQIVSLRKLLDNSTTDGKDPKDASSSTGDGQEHYSTELRTSEDLLQVISYLRRQKSIADAAHDAASAEVSRLLLRVSTLETQKEQLETELERERHACELAVETAQRHSEVMERVEQLNLLTESNRLLRHERETLRSTLSQTEEQLSKAQSDIGPLRQDNNTLRAQVDTLMSEKRSLEDERDRWKERCNRLVETAQRMDPEQYRLACNERDELQRKLRRAEEDVQQNVSKLNELRTESDERIRKLTLTLTESQTSYQNLEQKVAEFRTQCDSLKADLETKEMTVVKLRELARKYRQETELLRRQLEAAGSDEAKLQSTNEALTEAKADLVTLRADLSALRTQYDLSSSVITEGLQIIDEYKLKESLPPTIRQPSSAEPILQSDESGRQRLVNDLRHLLSSLFSEIEQLRQQSDMQKEKLLRMQLIESQLTKSLRDCAELRARLTDSQNNPTQVLTTSVCSQTTAHSPFSTHTADQEPAEVIPHSHPVRTTANPMQSSVQPVPLNTLVHIELTAHPVISDSSSEHSPSVTSHQSVPPWIGRAAATVQPVQPTPTVVPSGSLTASKQTAEIRPITSNVATVMPTPAPPTVPATSTPSTCDVFVPTTSQSLASTSNLEVNVSSGYSSGQLGYSAEQVPLLRGTLPRRPNLVTVPQPAAAIPASTIQSPFGLFNWSPNNMNSGVGAAISTSLFGVANKRRHEEFSPGSSDQTGHNIPPVDEDIPSGPTIADSTEFSDIHNTASTHQFSSSEAKRIRQGTPTIPTSSTNQGNICPVTIGRSVFGFSSPLAPVLQATASRLVSGVQESFTSPTAAVANIVTPVTLVSGSTSHSQSSTTVVQPSVSLPAESEATSSTFCEVSAGDVDMSSSDIQDSTVTESRKPIDAGEGSSEYPTDAILASSETGTVCDLAQPIDEVLHPTDEIKQETSDRCGDHGHRLDSEVTLIGSTSSEQEPSLHLESDQNSMDEAPKADSPIASPTDNLPFETEVDRDETSNLEIDDNEPNDYSEAEENIDNREVESTDICYSEVEEDGGDDDEEEEEEEQEEVIELSSGSERSQHSDTDNLGYESGNGDDDDEDDGAVDFDDTQNECIDAEQEDLEEHQEASHCSSEHDTEEEHNTDEESEIHQGTSRMNQFITSTLDPEQNEPITSAPTTTSEFDSSSSLVSTTSEGQKTGLFGEFTRQNESGGLFSSFTQPFRSTPTVSTPATSNIELSQPVNISGGLFKSFLTPNSTMTPSTSVLFKPSTLAAASTSTNKAPETTTSTDTTASRPKIQPIVWDSTTLPSSTSHTTFVNPPKHTGAIRRKKWGIGMEPASRVISNRTVGSHGAGKPSMGRSAATGGSLPPRRG